MTERLSGHHICTCNHSNDIHVRRVGRCLGTDPYGRACECVGFEHRPTRPDPCRHDKRQEPKPCRCNQFVACCDVDMDEHVEALMNVHDGNDHGER